MIGTVLNIKPVLTIQGEKLDAFEKARGVKQAKKAMIKAMKKDMDKRFAKERAAGIMGLHIAYTANDKEVIDGWIAEVKEAFPGRESSFYKYHSWLSVQACVQDRRAPAPVELREIANQV